MADVKKSKLQHIDTGILKKDACIVLVKTEWNTAIVEQLERGESGQFALEDEDLFAPRMAVRRDPCAGREIHQRHLVSLPAQIAAVDPGVTALPHLAVGGRCCDALHRSMMGSAEHEEHRPLRCGKACSAIQPEIGPGLGNLAVQLALAS